MEAKWLYIYKERDEGVLGVFTLLRVCWLGHFSVLYTCSRRVKDTTHSDATQIPLSFDFEEPESIDL